MQVSSSNGRVELLVRSLSRLAVLSLSDTAKAINASGKYPTKLMAKDVLRVERGALKKVIIRLGALN
ncbi:MAG: hypothetical protein NTY53_04110 [Kiritimatiellaeota bacterium]|nr:hypothetical protein [Kiritimatiellota bacterium]